MILAEFLLFQLHLGTGSVDQVLGFDSFEHLQLSYSLFVGHYFFLKLDLWCIFCWDDYCGSAFYILAGLLVCFVYQLDEENESDQQNRSDKHEDQLHQLSSVSFFFLLLGVLAFLGFFVRSALLMDCCILTFVGLFFYLLLIPKILFLSRASSWRKRSFKTSSFSIPSSSFTRPFSLSSLRLCEADQKVNDQNQYCDFPHARNYFAKM